MNKMLLVGVCFLTAQNCLFAGEKGGKWSMVTSNGDLEKSVYFEMGESEDEEDGFSVVVKTESPRSKRKCAHGYRNPKAHVGRDDEDDLGDLVLVEAVDQKKDLKAAVLIQRYWRAYQEKQRSMRFARENLLMERSGDSSLLEEAAEAQQPQPQDLGEGLRHRRVLEPTGIDRGGTDADDEATDAEPEPPLCRNDSSVLELCTLGAGYLGSAVKEMAREFTTGICEDASSVRAGALYVWEGTKALGREVVQAFEDADV